MEPPFAIETTTVSDNWSKFREQHYRVPNLNVQLQQNSCTEALENSAERNNSQTAGNCSEAISSIYDRKSEPMKSQKLWSPKNNLRKASSSWHVYMDVAFLSDEVLQLMATEGRESVL